jgi:glycosyltransferase involved in cell wall biosynthesis
MLFSAPNTPLVTLPQSTGYDVRCSQVFLTLSSLVEKVFTIEFVRDLGTSKLQLAAINGYVPCIFQYGNITYKLVNHTSTILNHSGFLMKGFEAIFSKRFWAHFKACDFIFIERTNHYLPLCQLLAILSKMLNKICVLEIHDIFSFGYNINPLLRGVMLLFEKILISLASWVVCFTYEESKYLRSEKVSVIPTSTLLYEPDENIPIAHNTKNKLEWLEESQYKIITFIGDLRTWINRLAVDYIVRTLAPIFLNLRKDVIFIIAGKGYELWKKCDVPRNVLFVGHLNKNELYYLLTKSSVCIAPLTYNTGFKSKIISYIVAKKPVVLTKEATLSLPLRNLPSLVVTSLENFPREIINVISHETIFQRKAEISYQYFKNAFNFDKFKKEYENLISFLATRYRRSH